MKPLRIFAALLQRLVDKIDPHEGRYRMLFERSPLPMWVVDTETLHFLAVNDAALRLYEYSREEFLALTARETGPAHDHVAFRDFLSREAEVQHGHFRHLKKTGEPIDIEAVGHLVAWRGRPARLVQINDITERLRALSRRLFEVQEEERRRLARDLHDDVGQALTALKIQLESLARPGVELAARSRVDECVDTVQHTLERVRQLSLSLRPPQLDDLGLAAALRSHLDRQARVAGLQAHFEMEDAPPALAPDTETACFRVAQEAINNVLRHARARNLWVRLFSAGGRLAISVRDDGQGFDLEAVRERSAGGGNLGLIGMEERMALAGGSFELRSAPGQGTVLLATFPIAASTGKERAVG